MKKTSREIGIGVKLTEAAKLARRGDVSNSDYRIGEAQTYAKEAGIKLSDDQNAEIAAINKLLSRD